MVTQERNPSGPRLGNSDINCGDELVDVSWIKTGSWKINKCTYGNFGVS